eukprot:TRINITY_DN31069_c0_g1_i1.p1 TRINITY_DN31069_c0_g1~~TRINITY_DN31069_c0_g1_i1.p1  ORF type:complete len:102 (-),score=13.92 TRINITY_DN31069_c0_g1_i1:166-471(-)
MSELEQKFKKAAYLIRHGPPNPKSTTEEKLKYYSYFKQATEGDVKGSQPLFIQFEARQKWDAWNAIKGMSAEEAMQKYIDLLAADDPNWESHPVLADYKPE